MDEMIEERIRIQKSIVDFVYVIDVYHDENKL